MVGLKVALPDGRLLEVNPAPRRAAGPSLKDLFVGAEGTMGVVVEASFRVLPYPERETVWGIGFPDYLSGLEALRRVMQDELRPAVARLYDEPEAATRLANYPDFLDYNQEVHQLISDIKGFHKCKEACVYNYNIPAHLEKVIQEYEPKLA